MSQVQNHFVSVVQVLIVKNHYDEYYDCQNICNFEVITFKSSLVEDNKSDSVVFSLMEHVSKPKLEF